MTPKKHALTPICVACLAAFVQPTYAGGFLSDFRPAPAGWTKAGEVLTATTEGAFTPGDDTPIFVRNGDLTLATDLTSATPLTLNVSESNSALPAAIHVADYLPGTPIDASRPYLIKVENGHALTVNLPTHGIDANAAHWGGIYLSDNATANLEVTHFKVGDDLTLAMPDAPWSEPVAITVRNKGADLAVTRGTAHWMPDTFVLNEASTLTVAGDVALNNAGTLYLLAPKTLTGTPPTKPSMTIKGEARVAMDSQYLNQSAWVGSNGATFNLEGGLVVRGIQRAGTVLYASPVKLSDPAWDYYDHKKDPGANVVDFAAMRLTNGALVTIGDHVDIQSVAAGKTYGIDVRGKSTVNLEGLTLDVASNEITGFRSRDESTVNLKGDHVTLKVSSKNFSQENPTVAGATGVLVERGSKVNWNTALGDQTIAVVAGDKGARGLFIESEGVFTSTAHNFVVDVTSNNANAPTPTEDAIGIHTKYDSKPSSITAENMSVTVKSVTQKADGLRTNGLIDINVADRLTIDVAASGADENTKVHGINFEGSKSLPINANIIDVTAYSKSGVSNGLYSLLSGKGSLVGQSEINITAKNDSLRQAFAVSAGGKDLTVTAPKVTLTANGGKSYGLEAFGTHGALSGDEIAINTTGILSSYGVVAGSEKSSAELTSTNSIAVKATSKSEAIALKGGSFSSNVPTAGRIALNADQRVELGATGKTAYGIESYKNAVVTVKAPTIDMTVLADIDKAGTKAKGISYWKAAPGGTTTLDGTVTLRVEGETAIGIDNAGSTLTFKGPETHINVVGQPPVKDGKPTTMTWIKSSTGVTRFEGDKLTVSVDAKGNTGKLEGMLLTDNVEFAPSVDFTQVTKAESVDSLGIYGYGNTRVKLESAAHRIINKTNKTLFSSAAIKLAGNTANDVTIGTAATKVNRVFALKYDAPDADYTESFDTFTDQKLGYAISTSSPNALVFHGEKTQIIGDGDIDKARVSIEDEVANQWHADKVTVDSNAILNFTSKADEANFKAFNGNVTAKGGGTANLVIEGTAGNRSSISGALNDRKLGAVDGTVNLTLENATWTPTGRSTVNRLTGQGSSIVDMTVGSVTDLFINETQGASTVRMTVNPVSRDKTALLYIADNCADIQLDLGDITTLDMAALSASPLRVATVKGGNALTLIPGAMETRDYTLAFTSVDSTDADAVAANGTYAGAKETARFSSAEVTAMLGSDPVTHWILTATRKPLPDNLYDDVKAEIEAANDALEAATTAVERQTAEAQLAAAKAKMATSHVTGQALYDVEKKVDGNAETFDKVKYRYPYQDDELWALEGLAGEHEELLATQEKAIAANKAGIESVASDLNDQKDTINTQATAINANTDAVREQTKVVQAQTAEIAQQASAITANSNALAQQETMTADLLDRIQTNERLISENTQAITALRAQDENHMGRLGALARRMDEVKDDMRQGLAMNAAMSGLFKPYNVGHFNVTAAFGGYKSEQAVALGSGYRVTDRVAVSVGVASSLTHRAGVMANVGVEFTF